MYSLILNDENFAHWDLVKKKGKINRRYLLTMAKLFGKLTFSDEKQFENDVVIVKSIRLEVSCS